MLVGAGPSGGSDSSPGAPTNVTAPVLDAGDGKIGTTMSVTSTGEWSITPDETEIRWKSEGVVFQEGGSSYVVDAALAGTAVKVEVRVRVTDGVWSSWVASNEISLPAVAYPVVTNPPELTSSGSLSAPVPGDVLGFTGLTYTGNPTPSEQYRWQYSTNAGISWLDDFANSDSSTFTIPEGLSFTIRIRLWVKVINYSQVDTYSNETADFGP